MQSERCVAKVSLGAIAHNFDVLSRHLPENIKKMAVVKADAYGHGAVKVSLFLEDRVEFFGVACSEEAFALRDAGIKKPILILSPPEPGRYGRIVQEEISVTLFSLAEARTLSVVALALGKKARVHLALDTGMGRIGLLPSKESVEEAVKIAALPGIEIEGIFSHFACADMEDEEISEKQVRLFDNFVLELADRGINPKVKHMANSAAALRFSKTFDLCRLGIALYGYAPSEVLAPFCGELETAMTVESRVICVKNVEKGTPIGYGHAYVAPEARRIATVSIGYGDGYNRSIGFEGGYVLLHGKRAPITGRVCMDQMMVDVTDIPEAAVGDMAVIMGKDGQEEIRAEMIGRWAHSFHYEVLCTFLPRVRRIYGEQKRS